jgi:hypothetical protein
MVWKMAAEMTTAQKMATMMTTVWKMADAEICKDHNGSEDERAGDGTGLPPKLKVHVNLIRHLQCFHCYQNEIHHLLLRGVAAGGLLVCVGPNVNFEVLRVLEVVLSLAFCPNRMTLDDVVQRRPL